VKLTPKTVYNIQMKKGILLLLEWIHFRIESQWKL